MILTDNNIFIIGLIIKSNSTNNFKNIIYYQIYKWLNTQEMIEDNIKQNITVNHEYEIRLYFIFKYKQKMNKIPMEYSD